MNGDVGKQQCGALSPTDPPLHLEMATQSSMAANVESVCSGKEVGKDVGNDANSDGVEASTMAATTPDILPQDNDIVVADCNGNPTTSDTLVKVNTEAPKSMPASKEPPPISLSNADSNTSTLSTASTVLDAATPAGDQSAVSVSEPPSREQIKQMVAQQVEYFFSRENLSNDPYLISQMDSDQYVPVFILANCSQFKKITKDHSIIVEVLKESLYVQLDEENNRVRPNYKRCIVILREIPESTPVEEIEAMFKGEGCPRVVSCEFVHNSSWYVTFDSDDDAQKAYRYLREVVKTFKDKPILARIKTKPMSRLGCLSVLPSYGGKGHSGDSQEGPTPVSTPGPTSVSGNSGTPGPGGFTPGGQRYNYLSTPSTNATSYTITYNTTASTPPLPHAFFYPNMMQWATPGGFYDINSFLQYNGLSPEAAFKPPSSHNRFNSRRNNKFRESGRHEKSFNGRGNHSHSHGSASSNAYNHQHYTPRHQQQQQPQQQQQQQPQQQQPQQQQQHSTPQNQAVANGGPSSAQVSSSSLNVAAHRNDLSSSNSFAHSDLPLPSHSNHYISFSPPGTCLGSPSGPTGAKVPESKQAVTIAATAASTAVLASFQGTTTTTTSIVCGSSASTTTTTTMSLTATTSTSTTIALEAGLTASSLPVSLPVVTSTCTATAPISNPAVQLPTPPVSQPSGPAPQRYNAYNIEHVPPQRDPQPVRQMPRGARRRPPRVREEDGSNGNNGRSNGGPSRGPATPIDKAVASHQQAQPQFDLAAVAFPPLPGADDQVPALEEKSPEPVASAWSTDNHRFSDVMKGTAKPNQTTKTTSGGQDAASTGVSTTVTAVATSALVSSSRDVCHEGPQSPTSSSPGPSTLTAVAVTGSVHSPNMGIAQAHPGPPKEMPQAQTSHSIVKDCATISSFVPTSSNTSSSCSVGATATGSVASSCFTANANSSTSGSRGEWKSVQRSNKGGGPKDRRDFGRGRENKDYKGNIRSGKENRPIGARKEQEKADADGWITKGAREQRGHHKQDSRQQYQEFASTSSACTTTLVNGAPSPPLSPKITDSENKATNVDHGSAPSLNNNDGEHKPSWAMMALASKEEMEKLSAELKEKAEQEKMKKRQSVIKPQSKAQDKTLLIRERDGKPQRREGAGVRVGGERVTFRPRGDLARPKSPK